MLIPFQIGGNGALIPSRCDFDGMKELHTATSPIRPDDRPMALSCWKMALLCVRAALIVCNGVGFSVRGVDGSPRQTNSRNRVPTV